MNKSSEGATGVSRSNQTDSDLLAGLLREAITKRQSGVEEHSIFLSAKYICKCVVLLFLVKKDTVSGISSACCVFFILITAPLALSKQQLYPSVPMVNRYLYDRSDRKQLFAYRLDDVGQAF